MANPAIQELIENINDDLPRSTLYGEKATALMEVFDVERMTPVLQEALLAKFLLKYSPSYLDLSRLVEWESDHQWERRKEPYVDVR